MSLSQNDHYMVRFKLKKLRKAMGVKQGSPVAKGTEALDMKVINHGLWFWLIQK